MTDETDADLFIEAQNSVWASVLDELKNGKKTSHWMWFVFPQLAALGQSDMSQLYGLHDLAEARAYLADSTLCARLNEACSLLLLHDTVEPEQIFGPVDALKLRSSMTLFSEISGAPVIFTEVLDTFYSGEKCERTLQFLG